MKFARRWIVLLLLMAGPSFAQQTRLDERLPAKTIFYVYWHGMGVVQEARNGNSLLRLWDDPEFALARDAFLAQLITEKKDAAASPLAKETTAALMEGQFLFGAFDLPSSAPQKTSSKAAAQKTSQDTTFLIYDAKNRVPLVQALLQLEAGSDGKPLSVAPLTMGRAQVEAVTGAKSTYYRAFVGTYFVRAGSKPVMEEVVRMLEEPAPTRSNLFAAAALPGIRKVIGERSAMDFYLNLGGFAKSIESAEEPGGSEVVKSLGLDQVQCVVGSLTFENPSTRLRMGVLGNAVPGSLFDLAGAGVTSFSTAALAPANALSYNVSRIDFGALYSILMRVAKAALPQQAAMIEQQEGQISQALGMTLREVFELPTGEFAAYALDAGVDLESNCFALGIRRPEEVLHILHLTFNESITNESREGDVTYLSVPISTGQPAAGAPRKRFFYVAITPQMLMVAPRKAMLREAIARMANNGGAGDSASLAGDSKFQGARARLPQSLNGMSYTDLSRVQWEKELKSVEELTKSTPEKAENSAAKSTANVKTLLNPAVLSRYLRLVVTGWWKERDGIYFDGVIE